MSANAKQVYFLYKIEDAFHATTDIGAVLSRGDDGLLILGVAEVASHAEALAAGRAVYRQLIADEIVEKGLGFSPTECIVSCDESGNVFTYTSVVGQQIVVDIVAGEVVYGQ